MISSPISRLRRTQRELARERRRVDALVVTLASLQPQAAPLGVRALASTLGVSAESASRFVAGRPSAPEAKRLRSRLVPWLLEQLRAPMFSDAARLLSHDVLARLGDRELVEVMLWARLAARPARRVRATMNRRAAA